MHPAPSSIYDIPESSTVCVIVRMTLPAVVFFRTFHTHTHTLVVSLLYVVLLFYHFLFHTPLSWFFCFCFGFVVLYIPWNSYIPISISAGLASFENWDGSPSRNSTTVLNIYIYSWKAIRIHLQRLDIYTVHQQETRKTKGHGACMYSYWLGYRCVLYVRLGFGERFTTVVLYTLIATLIGILSSLLRVELRVEKKKYIYIQNEKEKRKRGSI